MHTAPNKAVISALVKDGLHESTFRLGNDTDMKIRLGT